MIILSFDNALDHMLIRVLERTTLLSLKYNTSCQHMVIGKNVEVRMITIVMYGNSSPHHDSTDSSHLATKGSSWYRNLHR